MIRYIGSTVQKAAFDYVMPQRFLFHFYKSIKSACL